MTAPLCPCCQDEPVTTRGLCEQCSAVEPLRVFDGRPIPWAEDEEVVEL